MSVMDYLEWAISMHDDVIPSQHFFAMFFCLGIPICAVREIVLADKRDSKLLDAKGGPVRIVVPGDKRAARWVRQVTVLKLIAVK